MLSFTEIEKLRDKAGIAQADLCARAQIHPTTYSRQKLRPGRFGASERTITRLKTALDALIQEKEPTHG